MKIHGNIGKTCSKETRKKISEHNARYWLGKKRPKETGEKICKARIGMKFSELHKQNLSNGHKGQISWNKGLKGYNAGEKSHFWKGGIAPINNIIRSSLEYKLWQDSVFVRDRYCCKKCKEERIKKLVAHHIQNFAQFPEFRFAIDNGITLCVECHKKFHHIFGKKNNHKKQLIDFMAGYLCGREDCPTCSLKGETDYPSYEGEVEF